MDGIDLDVMARLEARLAKIDDLLREYGWSDEDRKDLRRMRVRAYEDVRSFLDSRRPTASAIVLRADWYQQLEAATML